MTSVTRRSLIGRGLGAAVVVAAPGSLLAAAPALAQESDETAALEGLIELEQAAELAYSLAAEDAKLQPDAKSAFEQFSLHCGEHATAFSEALDQLAVDPPDSSDDPVDYPSLAEYDSGASQDELLKFMIDVELGLIEAYENDVPALEAEDLIRSAAQVAASHAQHLVALRLLAGESPETLTELPEA